MRKMMITTLLGLTSALAITGCGAGKDSRDEEYAAGWSDGGYYYGSMERHSILTDPDDYEPGSGW